MTYHINPYRVVILQIGSEFVYSARAWLRGRWVEHGGFADTRQAALDAAFSCLEESS